MTPIGPVHEVQISAWKTAIQAMMILCI